MLFINTRPIPRAKPLTDALQANAISVLELPLLEMEALPLTDSENKKLTKLFLASSYSRSCFSSYLPNNEKLVSVLVVISPTAAEFGCQFLRKHALTIAKQTVVVAVGQSTADCLAKYGISAIIPKVANNESMLALDCLSQLGRNGVADIKIHHANQADINQASVMIWRGKGGRRLLIDDLRSRGVIVDVIEWYRRKLPQQSILDFYNLTNNQNFLQQINEHKVTVLISSGDAFNNWQQLIDNSNRGVKSINQLTKNNTAENSDSILLNLDSFSYLVLGARLSLKLAKKGIAHEVIDSLAVDNIVTNVS